MVGPDLTDGRLKYVKSNNVKPFDFGGLSIRDLIPGFLTSASAAQIDVAPGASHATAKSTRSDKIYICVSGEPTFEVKGVIKKLSPQDLLVIQRNEWFNYRNETSDAAVLFLIHVPPYDSDGDEFLPAETAA